MRRPVILATLVVLPLWGGCAATPRLEASARQGLPGPGQEGAALDIYTRDLDSGPELLLRNQARFEVLSADSARFVVSFVHPDETVVDPARWRVWLEDETGARHQAVAAEATRDRLAVRWNRVRTGTQPDVYHHERAAVGKDVFLGEARYVFQAPGLLAGASRTLTLVARRDDLELRYVWRLGGEGAPATPVTRHRGPSPARRPEAIVVPGAAAVAVR